MFLDPATMSFPKRAPFTPVTDLDERRRLHAQGYRDREIAELTGAKPNTITVWRLKEGLPPNSPEGYRGRLTPAQTEARLKLYYLGWSDARIAKHEGIHRRNFGHWRESKGLPPNFAVGVNERWREGKAYYGPRADPMIANLLQAIGRHVPPEIADDAAQDMQIDLLTGDLAPDQIKTHARRYINRVWENYTSRYKTCSLHEDLGDDGFTLLNVLRDESASDWLEEMGATVW